MKIKIPKKKNKNKKKKERSGKPVIIHHPESDDLFIGDRSDADNHCTIFETPEELLDAFAEKWTVQESDTPWDDEKITSSLEELTDDETLKNKRAKHRKSGTLDNYCEMLESQIGSLATKVINLSERESGKDKGHDESDLVKHVKKLQKSINKAQNTLFQAQQYCKENL